MKTLKIILFAAFVAAVSVVLSNNYCQAQPSGSPEMQNIEKSTVLPDESNNMARTPENYAKPGVPALTCNGSPVGSNTKVYVFGYRRPDGFCATDQVVANSYNEAWICARAFCDTCQVEEITGSYPAGTFAGVYGTTGKYCPSK